MEKQTVAGPGQKQGNSREAIAVTMWENIVPYPGSDGDGEKWTYSGYVLKVQLTEYDAKLPNLYFPSVK